MRQLMETLFIENNFRISSPSMLGGQPGFLAASSDESRASFFLLLFENENDIHFSELEERLHQYYASIKSLDAGYDRRMDKNFTLILCLNRQALTINEAMNRNIFELEEDPYHFRKLILPYTDNQVKSLMELHSGGRITDILYELLNDKEQFYDFKKHSFEPTAYNLSTRLFIKLPFLHYRGHEEDLDVLSITIQQRLEELELDGVKESALELIQKLKELSTEQTEDRSVLLNTWLGADTNE